MHLFWFASSKSINPFRCNMQLIIIDFVIDSSEYKSQPQTRNHSVYQKMIKLKCGNVTRLFLCVYLELMNIQVDDLELKPFRKSLILCCIDYAICTSVHLWSFELLKKNLQNWQSRTSTSNRICLQKIWKLQENDRSIFRMPCCQSDEETNRWIHNQYEENQYKNTNHFRRFKKSGWILFWERLSQFEIFWTNRNRDQCSDEIIGKTSNQQSGRWIYWQNQYLPLEKCPRSQCTNKNCWI